MPETRLANELRAGLGQLPGVDLETLQVSQLLDYLELLQRWNRTYNLTAIRDPAEMITRHLLDSLSVMP